MNRFALTAVVALGLGTAATADAQYVYRYYNTTPNGGVVITNNFGNWNAYGANRTYVSPFGGVYQRSYYGDVFGNTIGRSSGYSPFGGYGYNRGYGYNPIYPGGYNYNFYRRW